MKSKKGYILLEVVVSLGVIFIITGILYQLLFVSINIKDSIEDKIELQQQGREVIEHIENTIGNSKGIINIQSSGGLEELIATKSIRCRYKEDGNSYKKDKEIIFRPNYRKIFINNLSWDDNSQPGGYEIGDYIENLYIGINNNKRIVKITVELKKNKEVYKVEKTINILNFEVGEK